MAEKVFGDRTFQAGTALATDAIRLQIRLMKLIGPALEKLPAVFAGRAEGASQAEQEKANSAAIGAIASMFEKADPDEVVSLAKEICKMGMVSAGKNSGYEEIAFDHEFSGPGAKNMFPVIIFILQETLGDFFSGALASGSQAMTARH